MTIGDRLKQLRGRESMAEFGHRFEVSAQQISRIENNLSAPSLDLAKKICEHYDVSLDWFLMGKTNAVKEVNAEYIAVRKDELIELQKLAIRNLKTDLEKRNDPHVSPEKQ